MLVPFQSTASVDRLLSRVYAGVISFLGGGTFFGGHVHIRQKHYYTYEDPISHVA